MHPAAMSWSESGGLVPFSGLEPYVEIQVVASSPKSAQLAADGTSQQASSWLNPVADWNIESSVVAEEVSQDEMSGFNTVSWKMPLKFPMPVVRIVS